jgi:hypothetical protein
MSTPSGGGYPGDFNILTMDLTDTTGLTQSLKYVFLEMNWYEDIWNNQIQCNILINDGKNMLNNFPRPQMDNGIFGYETLNLSFQTPNSGTISQTFRLIGITDRKYLRDREIGYILHFVTPEAVQNLTTRVSKSYKGFLISDMVSDIHTNLLGGGPINIETTQTQYHFVIPNIFPCHAINWLASRANSAQWAGADYLYFQDQAQFNFISMETVLQSPSAGTYLYQIANVDSEYHTLSSDQVAASTYNFDHFSNILENIQSGMYGNELIVHSQIRKRWDPFTFDYPSSFTTYQHLYPNNPLYSTGGAGGAVNSASSKLKLAGDGPPDFLFNPSAWIPCRMSQLQQLQNVKLSVTVPGDSTRTVGQVVTFNIPSPEPLQNNQLIMDKYYQGTFVVTSVRHKIDPDKYVTTMELVKDSTFTPYPNS